MNRRRLASVTGGGCLLAGAVLAVAAAHGIGATAAVSTKGASGNGAGAIYRMPDDDRAMLNKYCVNCHNETDNLPAGKPLYLDEANLDDVSKDADTWELVIRKLGVGEMPPQGKAHPGAVQLQGFRNWLIGAMDSAAAKRNDPGNFVIHRLNRTEYANAVRDVLGVRLDVSNLLPPDSADFGFDNIATALQTTAGLLDSYISAAEAISADAVGDPNIDPTSTKFPIHIDGNQLGHVIGLPLGTRGGSMVHYNFPADGQYDLSAQLFRPVDHEDRGIEGQDTPNQFIILVDGVQVHSAQIGGQADHTAGFLNMAAHREVVAARMKVRTFIKAGPHDVAFTFIEHPQRDQDIYEVPQRESQDIHDGSGLPDLSSATITGPFNAKGVSANALRDRVLTCDPGKGYETQTACARKILATIARRAYRRPVTDADLSYIMPFYQQGLRNGGFDDGIRAALPRILTSPDFLFRTEQDPSSMVPGTAHRVSDLELASRLSFFLWSSVPDDELLSAAIAGRLHQPAVLHREVKRMLADQRSKALTTNFPDQWLELRNLATVNPDLLTFANWDGTLRDDLQTQTEMFFDSVVRENRGALDLLNADYTFVNGRIAHYYGIAGIYGTAFRRIPVSDPNRRGLLGQGSILALTSVATRTSPVFRGKWVLTVLLDVPPLPPPPNVPALPSEEGAKTMRARLDLHTTVEPCAGCHRLMDPIGFALENFGPDGQWRTMDNGQPIDASGMLLDGTKINGPVQLDDWLTTHPDVFVGTLTEQLMTYALGRGLTANDMPTVRGIVNRAAHDHYRLQDIVLGIIDSTSFQMRKKVGNAGPVQQTAQVRE